jgi:hypothetical protein
MSELGKRWVEALGEKAWGRRMKIVVPGDTGTLLAIYEDDAGVCSLYVNFDEECACQRYDRDGEGFGMLEPDTTDGATLGAMLAIVRGLSDPTAPLVPTWSNPGPVLTWCLLDREGRVLGEGPSEGAALVAAAEAWRRELTATTTNRGDHRE